jgi:NTP pyrophosphatase (non-canonical NTP hydrolase)
VTLAELQRLIRATFGEKDGRRGRDGTFMWFMEEIGELAAALRGGHTHEELSAEFADVLAWLATLANIAGVDLEAAVVAKYSGGCPECHRLPCACGAGEKP